MKGIGIRMWEVIWQDVEQLRELDLVLVCLVRTLTVQDQTRSHLAFFSSECKDEEVD